MGNSAGADDEITDSTREGSTPCSATGRSSSLRRAWTSSSSARWSLPRAARWSRRTRI